MSDKESKCQEKEAPVEMARGTVSKFMRRIENNDAISQAENKSKNNPGRPV
jgi:hypothetical protein